jgi:hypothetical protein
MQQTTNDGDQDIDDIGETIQHYHHHHLQPEFDPETTV